MQRERNVFGVDVFVRSVDLGVDGEGLPFDDVQCQIAHDHPDRRAADVMAAAKDAAWTDDNRVQVVVKCVAMHEMF